MFYYNKMANVDPKIWGEGLWTFMYSIAESLGDEPIDEVKAIAIKTFFNTLHLLLPCEVCSTNYLTDKEVILFPEVINKNALIEWINKIENRTNFRLDKPETQLSQRLTMIFDKSTANLSTTESSTTNLSTTESSTTNVSTTDKQYTLPFEDKNETVFGENKHLIILSQIMDSQKLLNGQSQTVSAAQTKQIPQRKPINQSVVNESIKSKIQNQLQKHNQMSKGYLQNRYTRSVQAQKMKASQQVNQQRVQTNTRVKQGPTHAPQINKVAQPKIITLSSPMKTVSAKEKLIPKKPCNCGKKVI